MFGRKENESTIQDANVDVLPRIRCMRNQKQIWDIRANLPAKQNRNTSDTQSDEVCIEPKFKDAATQWEDLTKTDHSYAAKLDHMNKSTQALGQTVADMLLDDDASRLYTGLRL
ncbi:hypothetical protein F2P79_000008 [Pimephales promelas]|nr:hypothetical protein F2P79_000008 [Pimephales promelas]